MENGVTGIRNQFIGMMGVSYLVWCIRQAKDNPKDCPFPERIEKLSMCWLCDSKPLTKTKEGTWSNDLLYGLHRKDLSLSKQYNPTTYCATCNILYSDLTLLKGGYVELFDGDLKTIYRCPECRQVLKRVKTKEQRSEVI